MCGMMIICDGLIGEEGGGVGGSGGGAIVLFGICAGMSAFASRDTSRGDPKFPGLEMGVFVP